MTVRETGAALLRSPLTNKGTAFTPEERAEFGLEGLLPPKVETLEQQVSRAYAAFQIETTSLGRYRFLRRVQDHNEVLFFALLAAHLREMLPVVYTPTVGEGVERFSDVYEQPRGLTLSLDDKHSADDILAKFPIQDPEMIVVTDSSAILGIGDQGWNGLGISIGKLALYTIGGGVSPFRTVPVVLDVGTDRAPLSGSATYLGCKHGRLRGEEHLAFVRKFVHAVKAKWPNAIVQWEDFAKDQAFDVLDAFRDELPSFNDDIQGTGAVALAGLITAANAKASSIKEERFLVFGAGAGGIGVARAIREGLEHAGLSRAEARARIFVVDSKGLLTEGRAMEAYKKDFAQPASVIAKWTKASAVPTLLETIANAKITALLGLSGQPGSFDEAVVRAAAENSARPIIFALSNPTSSCEAVPADVIRWTKGRAIVATGSPYEPVTYEGATHTIGQGNNAFIFPGLGFGAILTRASKITDAMVAEAAHTLADFTIERFPGAIYPPVEALREASALVAARVAARAIKDGVARVTNRQLDAAAVTAASWTPAYSRFRRA
jgi:malate dehydrogenase (oxaloacetate-decarboxylating)